MKWYNDIKIRDKLFIIFGALALIIFSFAMLAVIQINIISTDVNELIDSHLLRQISMTEAIIDIYSMRLSNISRGYLVDDDDFYNLASHVLEDHEEHAKSLLERLNGFRILVINDPRYSEPEKKQRLDIVNEIEEVFIDYIALARSIETAVISGNKEEVIRLYDEAIPAGNELTGKMQSLLDLLFLASGEKILGTTNETARAIRMVFIVAVIFIFLAAFALVITVKNISQPITNLMNAATTIMSGNLDFPIRSKRKDELGMLSNHIGDMVNKIKESLTAAEAASHAKSSFLANMSHEIRTPLNAILGITEIQLMNEKVEPEQREALDRIYSSGDLLLNIINDILDFSKIETGNLEINPSLYELAGLLNNTAALNMMRIVNKDIVFELSVDENTPSAMFGDELRIKQILNNLLSNAFKYTEKGKVKLSVFAIPENEQYLTLVFEVSDTGQGMTEDQISKVFDEYSRFNMDSNSTIEGTGLGMSITINLLRLMNGDISVKSDIGKGSVFTIHLPQQNAGSGTLGREMAEKLQQLKISDAKKTNIKFESMPHGSVLVVDDVESNLHVTRGLLKPYSLSIETVTSGFEAVDRVREGRTYDIVFMDQMMPKMDGIETVKTMRSMGYTNPIVALTANVVAGQSELFHANGFDGFIPKPVDIHQLDAILKKYVRNRQSIKESLIEAFLLDAEKSLAELEEIEEKRSSADNTYDDVDIRSFVINFHAMKSALMNVRETELSAFAARLEQAGRKKNSAEIAESTPAFLEGLRAVIEKLTPKRDEAGERAAGDGVYLRAKLLSIKGFCENFEKKAAKEAITELRQKSWPEPTQELLTAMSGHLLEGDYEEVKDLTDRIAATMQ